MRSDRREALTDYLYIVAFVVFVLVIEFGASYILQCAGGLR